MARLNYEQNLTKLASEVSQNIKEMTEMFATKEIPPFTVVGDPFTFYIGDKDSYGDEDTISVSLIGKWDGKDILISDSEVREETKLLGESRLMRIESITILGKMLARVLADTNESIKFLESIKGTI